MTMTHTAGTISSQSWTSRVTASLPSSFILLVVLHLAVSTAMGPLTGYPFNPAMAVFLGMLFAVLLPWFVLVYVIRHAFTLALVQKSQNPTRDMYRSVKAFLTDGERIAFGILRLLIASLFVVSSAYQKALITVIQPYSWDVRFAELDRFLHFGQDPWQLLMPLTGSVLATIVLNASYYAWFFLIYFFVFAASFARPDNLAARAFLVAYVLTFAIGGNAMAILFSSAGPVYFERLGFGSDFAPLMTHLYAVAEVSPLVTLDVQEVLWDGYVRNGALTGISAMPSMHVATSVLMAMAAFQYARWAGWAMSAFALLIMIGSVQLGWHYAVDGYLGAAVAFLSWRLGLRLARV